MSKNNRKNDASRRSWFQSDRFFQHQGLWYFNTREGTTEGPFPDRYAAADRLETYIKVMNSGLLGEEPAPDKKLGLSPKES